MIRKTKTYEVKNGSGAISGYASTWTREPDSYGDVVAKGAFADCIEQAKAEGKTLPLLYNHDNSDMKNFIGTVTNLEEDEHGLKFDAVFDDTPEGQRARELAMSGRLAKFSFAYDVVDSGEVEEDGMKKNELRKLNIHEVSLVLYPANPDTSVIEVKSGFDKERDPGAISPPEETAKASEAAAKSGRRNSAKDAKTINQAIAHFEQGLELLRGVLDDIEEPDSGDAKSKEPDTANDEERKARVSALLKEAEALVAVKEK